MLRTPLPQASDPKDASSQTEWNPARVPQRFVALMCDGGSHAWGVLMRGCGSLRVSGSGMCSVSFR